VTKETEKTVDCMFNNIFITLYNVILNNNQTILVFLTFIIYLLLKIIKFMKSF